MSVCMGRVSMSVSNTESKYVFYITHGKLFDIESISSNHLIS